MHTYTTQIMDGIELHVRICAREHGPPPLPRFRISETARRNAHGRTIFRIIGTVGRIALIFFFRKLLAMRFTQVMGWVHPHVFT